MAFTNVGPVTLIAPGQTITWWYSYGGNFGFQHAGADVRTPGAELIAFDQSKRIENNGSVTYFVRVRNAGTLPALHNLQGGGAV